MYGGKFACQNRLGWPYSWKEIYRFSLFYLVFEGNFQVQVLGGWGGGGGAYIWRGVSTEGFLRYGFIGLMFGGAYFRNFKVLIVTPHRRLSQIKEAAILNKSRP